MNKKEIKNLIENGESETLELKPSLSQTKEVIETLSALSNKSGGKILIGISRTGRTVGVQIGEDTIERLTNKITSNTEPVVYPGISVEDIEGRKIIVIGVKEAVDRPVLAFGRAFKRVGRSTLRISKAEYERMILENKKFYLDEQVCEGAGLENIDEAKVRWFLRKAKHERNFDVEPETPVMEALERLQLTKEGRLTNAAILLFGKNPQKFFLQAETRCARFKGTKAVKPFLDMKVFRENIFDQVDKALGFVLEHIPMEVYLAGKPEREERYEYPPDALREAIVNAICHRDYEISSSVQVRIFDDRIEIWGCGRLPEPLRPNDLRRKHRSILRNPLIARCFFLIKFIEQWGTGTNDMIAMCSDWGTPEPLFEEVAGSLVVTFRKYRITEEILNELSEQEKIIVNFIMEHKRISRAKCVELLHISPTTAFRYFRSLETMGIIQRKGKGKNTSYVLM